MATPELIHLGHWTAVLCGDEIRGPLFFDNRAVPGFRGPWGVPPGEDPLWTLAEMTREAERARVAREMERGVCATGS